MRLHCHVRYSSAAAERRVPPVLSGHRIYTPGKPIAALPVGTKHTTALPSGASVEVTHNAQTMLVQIRWQQQSFTVHLPNLLDACRVADVGEIECRGGLGSASAEAE